MYTSIVFPNICFWITLKLIIKIFCNWVVFAFFSWNFKTLQSVVIDMDISTQIINFLWCPVRYGINMIILLDHVPHLLLTFGLSIWGNQSKIQKLSMFGFFCNSGSEHSTPPARASNSVKIVKPSTPKRKFNNLSFYHLEVSVGL